MYKHRPSCKLPDSPAAPIWRYMDFTKLVSLFDQRCLYFANPKVLEDSYEGMLSRPSMAYFLTELDGRFGGGDQEEVIKRRKSLIKKKRDAIYVSCWHQNEVESAAMWRLYLDGKEGIAIKSTVERLCQAMEGSGKEFCVGLVNYIDYDTDRFPWADREGWVLHKRKSFAHERELRAIVVTGEVPESGNGILVEADLDVLIEEIFVAPAAPNWVADLVERVCQRYSIIARVSHSSLRDGPLY